MDNTGPFSKRETVRVPTGEVYRVRRLDESGRYVLEDESGTEIPERFNESSLKRVQILKG